MRKFLTFLFLVVVAAGGWLAYQYYAPAGPESEQFVMLRPGSSARRIATDLEKAGVIRNHTAFLLVHAVKGQPLKAGEYRFDHPANVREVYDRVARGDIVHHTVIVPEGFNIFDIAAAVEAAGLGTRADFLTAARENTLIADLDPAAPSLEGYLFPDTYEFTRTQSMHDIVSTMVHRFRRQATTLGINPGDCHRIVTMASVVEKETSVPEERPIVAGVFYNRLERGIPLATDPSVIYAAELSGKYNGVIHVSDLQSDSPYNTYKHAGLPPGPIANPGFAALQAALRPAQTDFLFFVSDNQGHHRFARTIQEHNRNVQAYRNAVSRQR